MGIDLHCVIRRPTFRKKYKGQSTAHPKPGEPARRVQTNWRRLVSNVAGVPDNWLTTRSYTGSCSSDTHERYQNISEQLTTKPMQKYTLRI